ncbi:hypothetical protein [Mycolicibacterium phlei]|uniref:hypothetical protein n=1 Tax=Mycolicibacterium phlei TaxID=1771 RepID=UPI00103F9F26|nr:hypothetical protein [Mycolicibacterium phlei]MBF4191416.1 hypothetical protein [Mycolicibacterium phlei]
MRNVVQRMPWTYMGYVCLLLTFAGLGMFAATAAMGSTATWLLGAGVVLMMTMAVVSFRMGARVRAAANESGIPIPGENIMAKPLRREQIDRYNAMYRNQGQVLAMATAPARDAATDRHAA